MTTYVAVDLGATSGRVVVGRLRGEGRFALTELHRFPNEPKGSGRRRVWDVDALLEETIAGLRQAAVACADERVAAVGVTAWGVDVGLLGPDGALAAPVRHYRSADPDGARALVDRFGEQELYARTGVLPQAINTVFRLREIVDEAAAGEGTTALLIPDLWCALLTGERGAERSIASTTGLVSLRTGDWDGEVLAAEGVSPALMPRLVDNRRVVGPLRPELAVRLETRVPWPFVRVASHDTASAVAAIGDAPRTAFVSSGTWSLVGVPLRAPITSPDALAAGFTNEAGLGGTTLFMRNLTGLWLLEQAARQWREQGTAVTLTDLVSEATAIGPTRAAFDITAPGLVTTEDVLGTIRELCADAGQAAPSAPGEVTRCIVQSLALAYRRTIALCERLTGDPVEAIHMIGGGTRNALLRRLTADACARPLRVGPVEGTALGCVAVQASAAGDLQADELPAVLARSADVYTVDPSGADARYWQQLDETVPTNGSAA